MWGMSTDTHTVGILEDDPDFLNFLLKIIDDDPSLALSFSCETVSQSLKSFAKTKPDLVLVDMQLPDGTGLSLIREVSNAGKLGLMLTILADRKSALAACEEGAHGYLLKDSAAATIRDGIHAALSGQSPISPGVAVHLLKLLRRDAEATLDNERPTARELTVLNMISRGLTYAEIAQSAGISVHTVGDHIKSIYRKLNVRSKNEAVHEARTLGWLGRFD